MCFIVHVLSAQTILLLKKSFIHPSISCASKIMVKIHFSKHVNWLTCMWNRLSWLINFAYHSTKPEKWNLEDDNQLSCLCSRLSQGFFFNFWTLGVRKSMVTFVQLIVTANFLKNYEWTSHPFMALAYCILSWTIYN